MKLTIFLFFKKYLVCHFPLESHKLANKPLTLFILDTCKQLGSLASSEYLDEMPHKVTFHQGLH